MTTFRVMIEFARQSQIAYIGALNAQEAINACMAYYDGKQFSKALRATVMGATETCSPDIVAQHAFEKAGPARIDGSPI